jgi:uncharacterized phage-like protein YoqJ
MHRVSVRDYRGGIAGAEQAGAVYCGRPGPLGNPCSQPDMPCPVCGQVHFGQGMVQLTECRSVGCYRRWLWTKLRAKDRSVLNALAGLGEDDSLACWCPAGSECHADVIAKAWSWCKAEGLFEQEGKMQHVIAGTGHRPPRLGLGYTDGDRLKLARFAEEQLSSLLLTEPFDHVISGGAQGWDQAVAHAARLLGIPYTVAVPFDGQESKWPTEAQGMYHHMLDRAARVVTTSPGSHAGWKFYVRDKWMVDNCHKVVALLDNQPQRSGTGLTVEYARQQGRSIVNLWGEWAKRA